MHQKNNRSIAFWSPLPPTKSGIADFGQEMLFHLSKLSKVDVYTSSEAQLFNYLNSPLKNVKYYSYDDYNQNGKSDCNLYQIGNDVRHIPIYKQALSVPGVVLLHDLSISPMLYAYLVNQIGAREIFDDAFEYSEGVANLKKLSKVENQNDNLALNDFLTENYFLRQLLESNYQVVTFLPLAKEVIQSRYSVNTVDSVFLGGGELDSNIKSLSQDLLREELDLPISSFVVGVFGFVIPSKQIEIVLKAIKRMRKANQDIHLVIVGEVMSSYGYDQKINALIKELGIEENISITGYVNNCQFEKYLLATNCVVVLRSPSNFQMSGIIPRALSASKPLILSDLPEWQFLPDSICNFVPMDDFEGSSLEKHLKALIENPTAYKDHVRNIEKYFDEEAGIAKTAEDIINITELHDKKAPKSFPELINAIQPNFKLEAAFQNLDSALQGKRNGKWMTTIKKIPIIGSIVWGIARYVSIQIALPRARVKQYQFNHELVEEINNLNLQVKLLRDMIIDQQKKIDSLLSNDKDNNG